MRDETGHTNVHQPDDENNTNQEVSHDQHDVSLEMTEEERMERRRRFYAELGLPLDAPPESRFGDNVGIEFFLPNSEEDKASREEAEKKSEEMRQAYEKFVREQQEAKLRKDKEAGDTEEIIDDN